MPPEVILLYRIVVAILGFLHFHMKLGTVLSRSLIHLDLSFVHGDRYRYIFTLLHVDIQLCQHHSVNMLLSILFFASLSKIGCLKVCGLISRSSIQFHWSSCLFLCQYQAVFSTLAL